MRRLRTLGVFVVLAAAASALVVAQSPQAVGTWTAIGSADNPFGNGAHVDLSDGHTLIVGGAARDGAATNLVAIFDTATNQFAVAGTLLSDRVGHTATLLKDGRVLVTGGITGGLLSTDIELFDPSTGSSTLVAQMPEPRRGHVAARLQDGSVLVAGGYTTGGAVLQTAFVFDPATNFVSPTVSGLQVARASASATGLIDGRVIVVGGTDGTNDLRSAEIFSPFSQAFSIVSTQLSVPVRGHSAVLLPNNGSVLIIGGTSNGVAQTGAELFLPAEFPDPFSWGMGQFAPTAAMSVARSTAIAGPTAAEGYAVVTGGGSSDVERYRFATIKTDKDDYAPGEHALITGTGWQPGERVTLTFQEDPAVHDDYVLSVTADEQGIISTNEWAPEQHDLNVRFYLTARGSRAKAQTTFTDGLRVNVRRSTPTAASLTVAQGSTTSVTFEIENNNNGGDQSAPITVNYQLTVSGSVSASGNPLTGTVTLANDAASAFRSWDITAGGAPFSGTVTLTATITSPCSPSGSNTCSANAAYAFTITPPPPPTDTTAPEITPQITGTIGSNGWYTSNVDLSWTVTDAESTVSSTTGCGPTTVTTDTAGITFTCSATSAGGTSSNSITIKRDGTAPSISTGRSPAANANGWNNTDVTATYTASDALSGLVEPATGSHTFSAEGAGQEHMFTVFDMAGNSASALIANVNIDKTAPSVTSDRNPAANGNGWNNTNVTVSYVATDALSGLDSLATDSFTFLNEGANQSHEFTVSDRAGNSRTVSFTDVNIDKTVPTISAVRDTPANANGWNNTDVSASYTASDGLSGLDSAATGSFTFTDEGAEQEHTFTVFDMAGNSASALISHVNIDKTAPSVTSDRNPAANGNGWNNTNVTVGYSATDALSGLDSPATDSFTFLNEGADQSHEFTVSDRAGNSRTVSFTDVNIDKTAPTITGSRAPAANANGWNNTDVTVSFICADTLSGPLAATLPSTILSSEGAGQSVGGTCTDKAGNSASATVGSINIDKTAPSVEVGGVTNGATYTLGAVPAPYCSTTDALSGVATQATLSVTGGVLPGVGLFNAACSGAIDIAGNGPVSSSESYTVQFLSGPNTVCNGAPGHQVLQPINVTGSSVFSKKGGSTVPVKFRVCGVNGVSVGPTPVVESFVLIEVINGAPGEVNETVIEATNSDTGFRWSASDAQWIFNLSTKNLTAGRTYRYQINLYGGTNIPFQFAIK